MAKLDSGAKEDVVEVFGILLRRQVGARSPTVDFMVAKTDILFILLKGYEKPEVELNYGMVLRECLRYEPLAKIVVTSDAFFNLFDYIQLPKFDVASDAFSTFKELLTRHGE